MDNYETIISLIISVIATINTFSKLEKNNNLSEDYFEKVVSLYVKEYKNNPSIDPVDFMNQNFDIKNYFIPNYIFYLVDKGEKEKLHKILLVDYREKYPNKKNNIFNGVNNIDAIVKYTFAFVDVALIILFFILGLCLSILLIIDILFNQTVDINKLTSLKMIIPIFIICIIMILPLKNSIHDDYVMQNEQIKKLIKRKENDFKNYNNNYYIK